MAFAKTILLAIFCLFSTSGMVQESDARDVQLQSGRSLAQLEQHSEISSQLPDDGNEGNEGDEGNEGSFEGDEGDSSGGDGDDSPADEEETPAPPGDGDDAPAPPADEDDAPAPPGDGDDAPAPPADEDDAPAPPGDGDDAPAPPADGDDAPAPPADEDDAPAPPADEEDPPAPPAEDSDDVDGGDVAAGLAGAGLAGAAAGAGLAGSGGDAPEAVEEEEDPMAPETVPGDIADAPGPVGTREFDPLAPPVDPSTCETLRDGLKATSGVLSVALDQIAPAGDPNELSGALDATDLNVTVLLPEETVLQQVAALLDPATSSTEFGVEDIRATLLNHIIPMSLEAAEILELGDGMVETFGTEDLDLMIDGETVMFASGNTTVTVVEADIEGCSGESVIHRINGIFLPDSVVLPDAGIPPGAETTRGLPGDLAPEEAAASALSVVLPAAFSAIAAAMLVL